MRPRQLVLPLDAVTTLDLDLFFMHRRMSLRKIAEKTGIDRRTVADSIDRVYTLMQISLSTEGYSPSIPPKRAQKRKVMHLNQV